MDEIPELIPTENIKTIKHDINQFSLENKIPITIVTGYLGAGKTTLLNYILTQDHGKKIAVILNEFGESEGIEKEVMKKEEKGDWFEEWLEFRNGCLCCSVKDAGVRAIENLLEKNSQFDYVILETTGLADPGPIISMFWLDDQLESKIQLDGVVTLVDAKYGLKNIEEKRNDGSINEASRQIALADRIIINKLDLVTDDEIRILEKEINKINSTALLARSERSKVNLDLILDLKAYKEPKLDLNQFKDMPIHSNDSDEVVTTITLPIDSSKIVQKNKLENWLQALLWEKKIPSYKKDDAEFLDLNILRLKGLVRISESKALVIQAVQELYEIVEMDINPNENPNSRLVLIGRRLNKSKLLESLVSTIY